MKLCPSCKTPAKCKAAGKCMSMGQDKTEKPPRSAYKEMGYTDKEIEKMLSPQYKSNGGRIFTGR